ncbi:uncharacterized protein N7496_005703 [Penicillium cataractarum]|uniref:Uncharacterized protein n=1 Tax=Penicillium cataractarum TaxID=2100454 RepID=A0A9W9VEY0_9EURO|nr:uncharacterized protein N7496_005703 [Penicillium cataractarum]KAJ5378294.1 hypothetical protein N7496_005703 [Penicillium cataractarum]
MTKSPKELSAAVGAGCVKGLQLPFTGLTTVLPDQYPSGKGKLSENITSYASVTSQGGVIYPQTTILPRRRKADADTGEDGSVAYSKEIYSI